VQIDPEVAASVSEFVAIEEPNHLIADGAQSGMCVLAPRTSL
jgi:hypothetical protein